MADVLHMTHNAGAGAGDEVMADVLHMTHNVAALWQQSI